MRPWLAILMLFATLLAGSRPAMGELVAGASDETLVACCNTSIHDAGNDMPCDGDDCDATCAACCRVPVLVTHGFSLAVVPGPVEWIALVADQVVTAQRLDLPLRPPRLLS